MTKRIFMPLALVALTLFACSGDDGYEEPTPPSSSSFDGLPSTPSSSSVANGNSSSSVEIPSQIAAKDFTFDDIQYWVGEGSNRAILIVKWTDGKSPEALAWGYKWSGTKHGVDMIDDIAKTDGRLFWLQFYSGPGLGTAVAGIGFDASGSSNTRLSNNNGSSCVSPVNGSVSTDSYDFDDWKLCAGNDASARFAAGWYVEGYWNYWVSDNISSKWEYSGLGASSRELKNNSVDAWYFDIHAFTGSELSTFPYCMEDPDNCDGKNYIGTITPVSKPR